MRERVGIILMSVILVSGCSVSSSYRSEGPCRGFHKDPRACERAYANSLVAGKVQLGQSPSDVRSVMGRDPERRRADAASEEWSYLTDYANQILMVLVFKQGALVEIKQASAR